MIPQGCRCKGLSDLRWRLGALLFAGLGRARPPALFFPSGTMSARNSPDNPCRGRAYAMPPRRHGPTRPQPSDSPLSVTDRFDKRLRIPVILLNNDPSNPRQTFIHPRGLFFFNVFIEHFYQSLARDGSLAAMGATTPDSRSSSRREASRQPLCVSIVTGSRRSMTQKLFRFSHFGIPFR